MSSRLFILIAISCGALLLFHMFYSRLKVNRTGNFGLKATQEEIQNKITSLLGWSALNVQSRSPNQITFENPRRTFTTKVPMTCVSTGNITLRQTYSGEVELNYDFHFRNLKNFFLIFPMIMVGMGCVFGAYFMVAKPETFRLLWLVFWSIAWPVFSFALYSLVVRRVCGFFERSIQYALLQGL